jgi:hypothetical protein
MARGDHCVRSNAAEMEGSNRKERHMTPYGDCVYCGGRIVERQERIDYRYHGQLFILERVPMLLLFFNNHWRGNAAQNAREMRLLLQQHGLM